MPSPQGTSGCFRRRSFLSLLTARCPCHVTVVDEVKLCQLLELLGVNLDTHAVKLLG